jgi:signal transduction histidine kinase
MATLVRAMKEFGQPAHSAKTYADVNRAVATTLTVASSTYREVADVELELGDVPEVACHIAELNQVFLQLIANAADAIGELRIAPARGTIRIRTWCDATAVFIRVSDNGVGIPDHVRARVFDPFFTTKPIGRGSGQGLGIARSIVVNRHGGTLTFETALGSGTSFLITIPR